MEENNDSAENPQQGQGRQNATKCGWLRKQGGFVKTWHTRWFVLKGDQLYYFKDEDETKPLFLGIFHTLPQCWLRFGDDECLIGAERQVILV
ncbi:Rho GTPase-activating protein 24 [Tupaia chinensis]|uniref:Rho GTPase-activating protein 24 n=1 Tax=Tupaia chinensis TaxID=246437 RepID=L9L4V7_TUPCH|nr:Rho GTPase-activating protein 24 [Tupaia chinensis]